MSAEPAPNRELIGEDSQPFDARGTPLKLKTGPEWGYPGRDFVDFSGYHRRIWDAGDGISVLLIAAGSTATG